MLENILFSWIWWCGSAFW